MRTFALLLVTLTLLVTGCETRPDGSTVSPFAPPAGQSRQYAVELRAAYAAAKIAFQRLDCELTDLSGAPYRLEASSRIFKGDTMGAARQLVADARFDDAEDGRTRVTLSLSIQTDDGGASGPSAQTKRQHGFYDLFFETLAQVLQEQADGKK